jgi:cbb3-type cytochrome oxidase cytochrome c subunit
MIDELTQNYQNLKNENDQNKKNLAKAVQEKEESVDNIKKQYERQKQKDADLIREYVHKVAYLNKLIFFKIFKIFICAKGSK